MKQSDILSFAINGVQMEIKHTGAALDELNEKMEMLHCNLKELVELDRAQDKDTAIGRPPGFVPVHEWEIEDD